MTDNTLVNVMVAGDTMYALTETHRLNKIDMDDLSTIEHVSTSYG